MAEVTIHLEPRLQLCSVWGCTNPGKYEAVCTLGEHETYTTNSPVCSVEHAAALVEQKNQLAKESGSSLHYRLREEKEGAQ